ncbi:hypothetical protein [Janibacter hoylei]|uniref:hypothetical protein n=1 Tax=Janibacter hoylei TaxID=364298 RepID=UPI00248FEEC9|nr:hypothetical protein [Janibacter hoylei]
MRDGTADAWRASLLPGEPMTPRHTWVVPPLVEVGGLRLRPLRDDDRAIADVASDDPLGEVLVFTRAVSSSRAGRRSSATPSGRARTVADNEASNRMLAGAGFTRWGREEAAEAPDGSVGPALHWERLA